MRSESDAWNLAKVRKANGDVTLFNTLGEHKDVPGLVNKVLSVWHGKVGLYSTRMTGCPYTLADFHVPPECLAWKNVLWETHALILTGTGGKGKTSLARTLLSEVTGGQYHFARKVDQLKGIAFLPTEGPSKVEGILWDEARFEISILSCCEQYCLCLTLDFLHRFNFIGQACLSMVTADDAKNYCDLEFLSAVKCRNFDGLLPAGVPRVFSTNHQWPDFWPHLKSEHVAAIKRRVLWVNVEHDLRRNPQADRAPLAPQASQASQASQPPRPPAVYPQLEDREMFGVPLPTQDDVFGLGGGLDEYD